LAWARPLHGVTAEVGVSPGGHEVASLGVQLPGDEREDARWYSLHRFGGSLLIQSSEGVIVARGPDLTVLLAAFLDRLPGARRRQR
jgi:hypothetical protein